MPRPTLTQPLAWAAAQDAGNHSMRDANRSVWDVIDYNACVREYNRLMSIIMPLDFAEAGPTP